MPSLSRSFSLSKTQLSWSAHSWSLSISFAASYAQESLSPHNKSLSASFSASRGHGSGFTVEQASAHAQPHTLHMLSATQKFLIPLIADSSLYFSHFCLFRGSSTHGAATHKLSLSISFSASVGQKSTLPQMLSLSISFSGSKGHLSTSPHRVSLSRS